jgi:hypothetical protein
LKKAALIGIPYNEFLKITPKILNIYIEAYQSKKELEYQEYETKLKNEQILLTIQAYQISRWVWAKRVDIKKILSEFEDKKEMTDDEMLTKVKALNALFGGEVK